MATAKKETEVKRLKDQIAQLSATAQRALDGWGAEQEKYRALKESHDGVLEAMTGLRKMLEDMRNQRDRAQASAERDSARCDAARLNLARAMGWVDAKMEVAPQINPDFYSEMPF